MENIVKGPSQVGEGCPEVLKQDFTWQWEPQHGVPGEN